MKVIKAVIREQTGAISTKSFRAESLDALRDQLATHGSELIQLVSMADDTQTSPRLSRSELIELFESISTLINAGLTIQQTMEIASLLQNDAKITRITEEIKSAITKGSNFQTALELAIENVPTLVSGMVRIGEKIGMLDKVLVYMLSYLRMMQKMREKIVSASLYPALIMVLAGVGVAALAIFFIPQMEKSFSVGNGKMAQTIHAGFSNLRIVLGIAGVFVMLPILLAIVYRVARSSFTELAQSIEGFLFRIPVFGSIVTTSQLLSTSYSLEVLSHSSVTLDEALILAAESGWSVSFRHVLRAASAELSHGSLLSTALSRDKLLPPYFIRWIQIAEQTGKVSHAFAQLRQFYEKELDKQISRVMALIEPVLIAFIGGGLLIVIMTVIVPLFSLYTVGLR